MATPLTTSLTVTSKGQVALRKEPLPGARLELHAEQARTASALLEQAQGLDHPGAGVCGVDQHGAARELLARLVALRSAPSNRRAIAISP